MKKPKILHIFTEQVICTVSNFSSEDIFLPERQTIPDKNRSQTVNSCVSNLEAKL